MNAFRMFMTTALLLLILAVPVVLAQMAPQIRGVPTPGPLPTEQYSPIQLYLSVAVLIFGLAIMGLEILLHMKAKRAWDVSSTKIVGVTLVIISGLFLIAAGYSEQQIAPMTGLLGTIAGYLLGRESGKPEG